MLTDRIVLTLPAAHQFGGVHEEWIKAETLATRIEPGEALAVAKA